MLRPLRSLLPLLVALGATASDATDKALAAWQQEVGKARKAHAVAADQADSKAVQALELIAQGAVRRGEIAEATAAWKEVLRIDEDHEQARSYFQAIGSLDQVIAEISAPRDPLGQPVPIPERLPADAPLATIAPDNPHSLGRLAAGRVVLVQYVSGRWRPPGWTGVVQSPDATTAEACRLAIAERVEDGSLRVLAAVPTGTAEQRFVWTVRQDIAEAVLCAMPAPPESLPGQPPGAKPEPEDGVARKPPAPRPKTPARRAAAGAGAKAPDDGPDEPPPTPAVRYRVLVLP